MLDVNVIPVSILNFVKNYDLQRPTLSAVTGWWSEVNTFLETFEFPTKEIEELFYQKPYRELADGITAAIVDKHTPLLRLLVLKHPMQDMLRALLISEVDHLTAIDSNKRTGAFKEQLKAMTISELKDFITGHLNAKCVGNPDLFNTASELSRSTLEQKLNQLDMLVLNTSEYTVIARQLARLTIMQESVDEDLKYFFKSRNLQIFAYETTPEAIAETGYLMTLAKLDYIYDLEVESLRLKDLPDIPVRDEAHPNVYDQAHIAEVRELIKDQEAFQKARVAQKLYSRVNNMLRSFENRLRDVKNGYDYTYANTKEGLREHYLPFNEESNISIDDLIKSVLTRRNETSKHSVFKLLNRLLSELDTYYNNRIHFASKRGWKQASSTVACLRMVIPMLISLPDDTLLKAMDTLGLNASSESNE